MLLSNDKFALRYYLVIWILGLLFVPVIARLYDLQVRHASDYRNWAQKQHTLVLDLEPERGQILDCREKVLASSLKVPSLYAVPRAMSDEDKREIASQLAPILSMPVPEILKRFESEKAFIWLKRRLNNEIAEQVLALKVPSLGIQYETKRFYPNGELASNILGICDVDDQGLDGLELYYNDQLTGKKGYKLTKRDALGREIVSMEQKAEMPVNGKTLVLNIDQFVQHVAERELSKAYEKWHAKGAACVVMDPKTGRILAMVSLPLFDPNNLDARFDVGKRNRTITDAYEPGSIFKVITAAGVLNENVLHEDDVIFCENGEYRYTNRRVLHDVHGYGNLTFSEVIIKSSNIGTVKAAVKLGGEKLVDYIHRFGFGYRTGVDIFGEVAGVVYPFERWSGYSITSVPIGQEVTVTPLQMARALSVIANGGVLVRPFLVSEIRDSMGVSIKKFLPATKARVISEETAERLRLVLEQVVEQGTGKNAAIPGVRVGGKTGTAQKILQNRRGYSHSDFISSFVGFAPVEDPMLVVTVMVDEPKPVYYGGSVAAPVFQEIVSEVLRYMNYTKPQEVAREAAA